jgi:hypothetical protein
MKPATYIELLLLLLGLLSDAYGQGVASGPGGAPPSSPTALPGQSGSVNRQSIDTAGTSAAPNATTGTRSLGATQATPPQTSRPNGPVQPIYQNSAAVDSRGGMRDSGQDQSAMSNDRSSQDTHGNNNSERGELGVWLVPSGGPGVEINRVTEGSPADKAGLRSGDVVLQVNGRGMKSPEDAARTIRSIPIGETATLSVWRDGDQQQVQVTMEPARNRHEVGYRGSEDSIGRDDAGGRGDRGDLESRISRIEQQLTTLTEELQQLRRQSMMTSAPGAGGAASSAIGAGATAPGAGSGRPITGSSSNVGTTGSGGLPNAGAAGSTSAPGSPAAAGTPGETGNPTPPAGSTNTNNETDSLFK